MPDSNKISDREITPSSVYFNRRTFIRGGILAASVAATGLVYRKLNPVGQGEVKTAAIAGVTAPATNAPSAGFSVNEPQTSFEDITHYNNFYEFSTSKEGVAPAAARFDSTGWQVKVEGLVRKPRTLTSRIYSRLVRPRSGSTGCAV